MDLDYNVLFNYFTRNEYDVDNFLDLYKLEISDLKKPGMMHMDGIDFTTNICFGESSTLYSNGDRTKSKIEFDDEKNVISFTKTKYIKSKDREIVIKVTKDEITINKTN